MRYSLPLLVLGLMAGAALANSQDSFGFGMRAMGMGGALTADASDFSASYYNPAGLGRSTSLELTLEAMYADYGMRVDGSQAAQSAESVDDLLAMTFGISGRFPFGQEDGRFSFGMGMFTPAKALAGTSSSTSGTAPVFGQYGPGQDKLHMLPALSFRVFDRTSFDSLDVGTLYIGLGASILTNVTGEVSPTIDLSSSNNQTVDVDFSFDAQWDAAPTAGILYEPTEWLRFGVCYRGELSLKIDMEIIIQTILARDSNGNITSSIDIPLNLEQVTLFDPQQVAVGFAIEPIPELTLVFDLTWKNWSAFPSLSNVLSSDIIPTPVRIDADFRDIVVPRFGAEWSPVKNLFLRAGYGFLPSPVPEQDGVSNVYDADRHVFSIGLGFFWEESPQPVQIDSFLQVHWLQERTNEKDDPADSVGNSDISGTIVAFGLGLKFPF